MLNIFWKSRSGEVRGTAPVLKKCILDAKLEQTMADSVWIPTSETRTRHAGIVRITHWLTALSFLALLVTGIEIVLSHPRFYWGETGNVNMEPLFRLPFASSRGTVPTGYGYVLPDQNGWSRYLHFQAAWLLVFTGFAYVIWSLLRGHFGEILPDWASLRWASLRRAAGEHLRLSVGSGEDTTYNVLQRIAYSLVVFVLAPLVVWTGLAMSPGFRAFFPWAATVLGGQQSARTLHFFLSISLFVFFVVHVIMVCVSGFKKRMRAMIVGEPGTSSEEEA